MSAMQNQQRPTYFLQPRNGRTLLPMKRMFSAAIDNGYRSQAAVFPSAPCDETTEPDGCDDDEDPEWK